MTDASLTPSAALLLVVIGGILALGAAGVVHSAGAISIAPVKIAYEIPAPAAHADSEPLFPGQPAQSPTPRP